jgi:hypothetical protein
LYDRCHIYSYVVIVNIYINIYIYICIYTYTYIHIHLHISASKFFIWICIHPHVLHIYIYICTRRCIFVIKIIYVDGFQYTFVYIHIYTYIEKYPAAGWCGQPHQRIIQNTSFYKHMYIRSFQLICSTRPEVLNFMGQIFKQDPSSKIKSDRILNLARHLKSRISENEIRDMLHMKR